MSDPVQPLGGTELMFNELQRRISRQYFDKFSIFNYAAHANFNKPTIYWNQLSYDQEAVQFLLDLQLVEKINRFVFVSNWQAEIFRKMFNLNGEQIKIMRNACLGVTPDLNKNNKVLKICYMSTPWRGLNVLLRAWELLRPANCELHVFSSTKIYGQQFDLASGNQYDYLYEKCNSLKGVVYRGMTDNAVLRGELSTFDILAYPSTFEETSCISVIDALSAGLKVVCSNIGALPETTEGWAEMYSFVQDNERHAQIFASKLSEVIAKYKRGDYKQELQNQVNVYGPKWGWNQREKEWLKYLDGLQ